MKLIKFRVTGFRSVEDSGWIDTDGVTALIGTNESGKTNLLLPLWKLNPAKEGAIEPVPDYPRKRYNEIRVMEKKPVFIHAVFEADDALAAELALLTGAPANQFRTTLVTRDFGGKYTVAFPDAAPIRAVPAARPRALLDEAGAEITRAEALRSEESLKVEMLSAIAVARTAIPSGSADTVASEVLTETRAALAEIDLEKAGKRSSIAPAFGRLIDAFADLVAEVSVPHPQDNVEARKLVIKRLPKFVYYSNYGNLDSEIYLPHVIENLQREGLGTKEGAKARTLKVLFEFVKLSAGEILELGQDFQPPANQPNRKPTDDEIAEIAKNKKERSVLLQAAGTELTEKFRGWWRQGDYRFRFQADGDHFRIWVSDDKRPEEIELEERSTGLQWFLSFFLIFLVERADAHANAVLLLDEPGHSLHPLAQRDLSEFFDGLAETNQLLYTTHSPFLVDPDRLDRVKAVYVQDDGTTAASSNLRAAEPKTAQGRSLYPVYAALGLTVSDTLLQGCQIVIVEGSSDQHYLTAMKTLLVGAGCITPKREIIFVPAGGAKGIAAVAAITTGKDEQVPYVLIDSDGPGVQLASQLRGKLYAGSADRLIMMEELAGVPQAEVEDLIPTEIMVDLVTRWLRGPDRDFDEVMRPGEPIVGQIEAYAVSAGKTLELGWKVELAKRVKARLLKDGPTKIPEEAIRQWSGLFARLLS